jgi:ABC-type dipeptide/oligopeptide/nickel transport system ATPase subunit
MTTSDQAITSESEDKLNRKEFSKILADTLISWEKPESIVVGLFGPWGSGKTSILNLAIEEIEHKSESLPTTQKPIIIKFNPWNISDKDQLLRIFFQEIYSQIAKNSNSKINKKIFKQLNSFAKALGSLESIPVAGVYFSAGSKLLQELTKERNLTDQKHKLAETFLEIDRKIIVVIDDIDRLSEDEIKLLFQIIKMNADFPNTIYLAAFDRSVVENALTTEHGINGKSYLEKIIQVGINIPAIERERIFSILFSELNQIFETNKLKIDAENWPNYFHNGLKDLFTSVRDVKRFINSLEMTITLVRDEVNTLDFITLEAIRVFSPVVYEEINSNRTLFLFSTNMIDNEQQRKEFLEIFEKIISSDDKYSSEIIKKILVQLFPQLNKILKNTSYANDYHRLWQRDQRICSEKYFDTFFLLGIPEGNLSQSEIKLFIEDLDNPKMIQKNFDFYLQRNKFRQLINLLRDKPENIDSKKSINLIKGLINSTAIYPDMQNEILDFGSDIEQIFLILDLLGNLKEVERFNIFIRLVKESYLYPTARVLSYDFQEERLNSNSPLFSLDQHVEIKNSWLMNLHNNLHKETFLHQKGIMFIMQCWKNWENDQNLLKGYLESVLKESNTFLDFVNEFIFEQRSQSFTSAKIQTEQKINLENLEMFYDIETLKSMVTSIEDKGLSLLSRKQKSTLQILKSIIFSL